MSQNEDRKAKLRELLRDQGVDLLLLYSNSRNTRYSCWISEVPCRSEAQYYFIDQQKSGFLEVSYKAADLRKRTQEQVLEMLGAIEAAQALTALAAHRKVIAIAGPAPYSHISKIAEASRVIDLSNQVDQLLQIKSTSEQALIWQVACDLRDCVEQVGSGFSKAVTEFSMAGDLRQRLMRIGDDLGFPPVVIGKEKLKFGTSGSPDAYMFQESDAVLIDAGIARDGYQADCTRMFFRGNHPLQAAYQRLLAARLEVISKIYPGLTVGGLLEIMVTELRAHDLPAETLVAKYLGHGLGYAQHEPPWLCLEGSLAQPLIPGMVFTLEPNLTLPDGDIRVEDTIFIKESGIQSTAF